MPAEVPWSSRPSWFLNAFNTHWTCTHYSAYICLYGASVCYVRGHWHGTCEMDLEGLLMGFVLYSYHAKLLSMTDRNMRASHITPLKKWPPFKDVWNAIMYPRRIDMIELNVPSWGRQLAIRLSERWEWGPLTSKPGNIVLGWSWMKFEPVTLTLAKLCKKTSISWTNKCMSWICREWLVGSWVDY